MTRGLDLIPGAICPVQKSLLGKDVRAGKKSLYPTQEYLFAWERIDALGDLQRLVLVIETMPDEALMRTLEHERGRGRLHKAAHPETETTIHAQ